MSQLHEDGFKVFLESLLSDRDLVESIGTSFIAQANQAEHIVALANAVNEQASTIGRLVNRVSVLERQLVATQIGQV